MRTDNTDNTHETRQSFFTKALTLGASYMLGAFNDNFFKQSALLLAVSLGLSRFQAYGAFLFALPFVLFSAWGGWLADRYPKKRIVIAAKCLELTAMLVGAWGIVNLHWPAIMLMLFFMGGSSTLFSPALNGSIPELFPRDQVPRVNGLFKLCTTVTILLGVTLAGWALEREWLDTAIPFGRWLVAAGVLLAALLGLASTVWMPFWPASAKTSPPFPWLGVWDSLRDYGRIRRDRALALTIAADAFFYGLSTAALLAINDLGLKELGFSKTQTSLLPAALMAGICAGALLAARGTPESWRARLVPSCLGIGLALLLAGGIASAPLAPNAHFWGLLAAYALAGVSGGIYIIPVSSFIQVRPAAGEKGRVLGTSNCLSFTAIMLAGPVYWVLSHLAASIAHMALGLATVGMALALGRWIRRLPEEDGETGGEALTPLPPSPRGRGGKVTPLPLGEGQGVRAPAAPEPRRPPRLLIRPLLALLRRLLALRYRVRVSGLDAIRPDGRPILFLPNHAALTDPILLYSRLADFMPRPLADEDQVDRPFVRQIVGLTRPVTKPDLRVAAENRGGARRAALSAVEEALLRCIRALKAGDNLLFYPAGMLTRDGHEHLGGNSGALRLIQAVPECRVVLVRTRGLWGSSFGYAQGRPDTVSGLIKGGLALLANGLFFMPRRELTVTFAEMPRTSLDLRSAAALNRILEAWYEAEPEIGQVVPRFFWQGARPRPLPEKTKDRERAAVPEAPEDLRHQVLALIAKTVDAEAEADNAGGATAPDFAPDTRLSADLGIDSLALAALAQDLEAVAGHPVTRLDLLITVEDCVRAAAGLLAPEDATLEAPESWFAAEDAPARPLTVPEAANLPQTILRQAQRDPEALILAEAGGALTWQDLWLRALALSLFLRRECQGEDRVGLMLPASSAAILGWLAVLLAGKTPVLLNWTTGPANFRHCVQLAGLKTLISSSRLLDRLEAQGFAAEAAEEAGARWLPLEEAASRISPFIKLAALLRSRLALLGWERAALPGRPSDTAAILFTSGSEAAPKGVPLTHANILANCRDIVGIAGFTDHDRMLAMLPPFHSLGLTVNIALPLCFGLPVVLHPNPTEAARLVRLCARFRPSITVAPPSFLDGMLQEARHGELKSLRLGVVGAEACPTRVYAAFAEKAGGALIEGYGVTECAPVISVNRPDAPEPGTIGLPLASVAVALVTTEGPLRRVKPGEVGMLLASGPNVFSGYLRGADGAPTPADPFVDFEGRRWYRTGDLARQHDNGTLVFAGRLGRFVKLGGEMLSLPQMEQALLDYAARRAAQTGDDAGAPAGPALAVEATEQDGQPEIVLVTAVDMTVAEANQALRAAGLSALYAARRVIRVESLPLLGTGKTDYRSLKRLIAETTRA